MLTEDALGQVGEAVTSCQLSLMTGSWVHSEYLRILFSVDDVSLLPA